MAEASKYFISLLALCGSSSSALADELGASRLHSQRGPLLKPSAGVAKPQLGTSDLHERLQGLASTALRLKGGSTALETMKVPLAFAGWYLMSIFYSVLVRLPIRPLRRPLTPPVNTARRRPAAPPH